MTYDAASAAIALGPWRMSRSRMLRYLTPNLRGPRNAFATNTQRFSCGSQARDEAVRFDLSATQSRGAAGAARDTPRPVHRAAALLALLASCSAPPGKPD